MLPSYLVNLEHEQTLTDNFGIFKTFCIGPGLRCIGVVLRDMPGKTCPIRRLQSSGLGQC
jgi:hypothetical protein